MFYASSGLDKIKRTSSGMSVDAEFARVNRWINEPGCTYTAAVLASRFCNIHSTDGLSEINN